MNFNPTAADAGTRRTKITRQQVAARFCVHTETVKRWQQRGLLPALKFGWRTVRYSAKDVERLAASM